MKLKHKFIKNNVSSNHSRTFSFMAHFYIDDSVHDEAGFIIGALVYSQNDIEQEIIDIIKSHNFNPENFEFKSSANYSKEPEKIKIRQSLKELMHTNCKLGIVVIPRENRDLLGIECIKALKQFLSSNNRIKFPLKIYFDQGMFQSREKANELIDKLGFENCNFHLEQDSKTVRGIQLADLSAHICSIQLKDNLGLITKKVKAGENSGYDPESEMELGFEMWATLRYSFFNQETKQLTDNPIEDATFDVEPYGLYVSELCNSDLTEHVRQTFGTVYLGCIH